jgi:phosphoribosylamine---glycine ligase
MKILILDNAGLALDFSMRAVDCGHKVKHFIPETPTAKHVGVGLSEIVRDYKPWINWADLIFLPDNIHYHGLTDRLKDSKGGPAVFGATKESASWEIDRKKGMDMFKAAGIPTAPYKIFTKMDEAAAFVKKTKKRYVAKPTGDDGSDKTIAYCAKGVADMLFMMERVKKQQGNSPFMLQEFIPGTEMAVGGWLGPHGFNSAFCENFEFKKFLNDDLGVNTGEMGTVLRYTTDSKLARKVLTPLEDLLVDTGHTGYVDVNCMVDEEGTPWPLEFTMRPGWPTFNIQQVLHDGDCAEWMLDLCHGLDQKNTLKNTVAIGVYIAIPDFPYANRSLDEIKGVPLYGVTEGLLKWFHPLELMAGMAPKEVAGEIVSCPMLVSAGSSLCVITATGPTIQNAQEKVYRRVKRLSSPSSLMYRTDIGMRLKKQLQPLQATGYAKGLTFA